MMTWLYRGVYSCSSELHSGLDADLYLNFPLKMMSLLKSYNIEIIAVFDGQDIQAKQKVDKSRKDEKDKNIQIANELIGEGKFGEAKTAFRRALKITSKMLNTMIEVLRGLNIKVIVAPYEADSQIAYLCKSKLCDFAISEDSDLVPYGCERILYKLDTKGECSFYSSQALNDCKTLGKFDFFRKMEHLQRVEFCVLQGCDYLTSIKGIGAIKNIDLYKRNKNMENVFDEMELIPSISRENRQVGI